MHIYTSLEGERNEFSHSSKFDLFFALIKKEAKLNLCFLHKHGRGEEATRAYQEAELSDPMRFDSTADLAACLCAAGDMLRSKERYDSVLDRMYEVYTQAGQDMVIPGPSQQKTLLQVNSP